MSRRSTVRLVIGALAGVVLVAGSFATPPVASASADQLMVWSFTGSQTATSYYQPPLTQPADYTAPIDFERGEGYLRIRVTSKPSNATMYPQVCFWQHTPEKRFKYETCAQTPSYTFDSPGTYYIPLGTPADGADWWKLKGVYDWSIPASVGRIMMKDPATSTLFLSSNCGKACYTGEGELTDHVPVGMTSELVFVPRNQSLTPPTAWRDTCPSNWSSLCLGPADPGGGSGGGGDPGDGDPGDGDPGGEDPPPSPTAPEVTVVPGDGSLEVSWAPVDGAKKYQFRYRSPGTNWNWDQPAETLSRTVTGLTNGTTYEVAVRALVDGVWREWTTVNATPMESEGDPGDGDPGDGDPGDGDPSDSIVVEGTNTTPTVRVTVGDGSLSVAWDAMPGVTLYQFRYSAGGGLQWDAPAATLSRELTGLTNGVEHTVEVRALINKVWQNWTTVIVTPSA